MKAPVRFQFPNFSVSGFVSILALISVSAPVLMTSSSAQAWSRHHLITEAAISSLPALQTEMVTPTPFEPMIKALGYENQVDFNTKNHIKKEFSFDIKDTYVDNQTGETLGVPVSVASVLALFADEPDWNMDRELFGEYPELWKNEYAYMGGKTGITSQAFRHMYWRNFDPRHPVVSFKIPNFVKSMGEAPDRAALFIDLARKAHEAGVSEGDPQKYRYWSVRFIANALHYLEDVSQPFHASQIQTRNFMLYPFKWYGAGKTNYVQQVTNVVAYYHLSFEDYVAYVMFSESSTAEAKQFHDALFMTTNPDNNLAQAADSKDVARLVKAMAGYSQDKAPDAAEAAESFFPAIDDYFNSPAVLAQEKSTGKKILLDQFPPEGYMDTAWWTITATKGKTSSKEKQQYFGVVNSIFAQLGYVIRSVVMNEVPN